MKTVYSEKHRLHQPQHEFVSGKMVPFFEKPSRADYVFEAVTARDLGPVLMPKSFSLDEIVVAHTPRYIEFLQQAHALWRRQGLEGDALGSAYNVLNARDRVPSDIQGQMGLFTGDGSVPITATTWEAALSSAFTALTAAELISGGESSAFALCRPPGHHACREVAGGYCYINNAAVAALSLLRDGASRIAVLDVDYHHGNGTQDIFYRRKDVLFTSLHADPAEEYPYFAGYADEKGEGEGEGYNLNYPLPLGCDYRGWSAALSEALGKIGAYAPDVLIVSLGVDTYKDDPISKFRLDSPDYLDMGAKIGALGRPTLFVMEGGYAVQEIGLNAVNVLSGFMGA